MGIVPNFQRRLVWQVNRKYYESNKAISLSRSLFAWCGLTIMVCSYKAVQEKALSGLIHTKRHASRIYEASLDYICLNDTVHTKCHASTRVIDASLIYIGVYDAIHTDRQTSTVKMTQDYVLDPFEHQESNFLTLDA